MEVMTNLYGHEFSQQLEKEFADYIFPQSYKVIPSSDFITYQRLYNFRYKYLIFTQQKKIIKILNLKI